MAKKKPKAVIKQTENLKWELVVNGEVRLAADAIFEKKIFDNGNGAAVIYQEKNDTKLFVIILDPPMEEYIDLIPCPSPGFAMWLVAGKEEKKFSLHYRSRNKFYIFRYFFGRLETNGPFDALTADHLLEIDISRQL